MPRLTEIQSAQIVALLEVGLSQSGIEQELERALHSCREISIWHEIPQDSIRACINMQEHLGEVIRCRVYVMILNASNTCPLIRQIGFGVRKYCGTRVAQKHWSYIGSMSITQWSCIGPTF